MVLDPAPKNCPLSHLPFRLCYFRNPDKYLGQCLKICLCTVYPINFQYALKYIGLGSEKSHLWRDWWQVPSDTACLASSPGCSRRTAALETWNNINLDLRSKRLNPDPVRFLIRNHPPSTPSVHSPQNKTKQNIFRIPDPGVIKAQKKLLLFGYGIRDPRTGMGKKRIRDKHPGSATRVGRG